MGFGRSLTIDLSLSRLVFLGRCLHLRDEGGHVAFGVGRCNPTRGELAGTPTSFES